MNPYPVLLAALLAVLAPAAAGDQRPIVEAYTHDLADPTKSRIAHVVIDGWWKLIEPGLVTPNRPFANVPESTVLYDLKNDPLEKTDVAKEHPEEVARLKALLAETCK